MNCEIIKNSDIFYGCATRFRNKFFSNHKNKRALSDVIATILLLAVTMALAVMLSAFFQESGFANIGSNFNPTALESQIPPSIKLTGYDTRDGIDLSGITFLDNAQNGSLCTKSCTPTTTEFIVLKIKNDGSSSYTVDDILINGIDHLWDGTSSGDLSSGFPNSGKFRIIKTSTTEQRSDVVAGGEEVRIVIRLSKDLTMSDSDVGYYMPLKIVFLGSINAPTFVIFSGDIA